MTQTESSPPPPLAKRRKTEELQSIHKSPFQAFNRYNILPLGNSLLSSNSRTNNKRINGLGKLSILSDEILLMIFLELDWLDLLRVQGTSQMFFAWCAGVEGFWKVALLRESHGHIPPWKGSWRRTFIFWRLYEPLKKLSIGKKGNSNHNAVDVDDDDDDDHHEDILPSDKIQLSEIYSDILFLPYQCASYDNISKLFLTNDDNLSRNNEYHQFVSKSKQKRRNNNNIPFVDGKIKKDLPHEPVIVQGLMENWAAFENVCNNNDHFGNKGKWSMKNLSERFPHTKFDAESSRITLRRYEDYMHNCCNDESPVYLFDADFVEKTSMITSKSSEKDKGKIEKGMGDDYIVPKIFQQDLFGLMDENDRPDFRWVIIGPNRSGSTWHQDPNGTSAWNAVIEGIKGWILFPPHVTPPGVFVSDDHADVQSPLSVAEWFMSYYHEAVTEYGPNANDPFKRGIMRQGLCSEGEIFYIPSGWWHLVINLSDSIAVTQNYVSARELGNVLYFMKHRPDQISGFGRGKRRKRRLDLAKTDVEADIKGDNDKNNDDDYYKFSSRRKSNLQENKSSNERKEEEQEFDETGKEMNVFETFCNVLKSSEPDIYEMGIKDLRIIEAINNSSDRRNVDKSTSSSSSSSSSLWDRMINGSSVQSQNSNNPDDVNGELNPSTADGGVGFTFSFDI